MTLPTGYQLHFLRESTACFWTNTKGESGRTFRWNDSRTYVRDCIADAFNHLANQ